MPTGADRLVPFVLNRDPQNLKAMDRKILKYKEVIYRTNKKHMLIEIKAGIV
jgi:hypothetical protein